MDTRHVRSYQAADTKKGFTLQELRQIVADGDSIGLPEDATFARTGVTGLRGQLRNIELVCEKDEETPHA